MRKPLAWLCFLIAAPLCNAAGKTPMFLLYGPALGPDGSSFVFEWDNDIWQASTETGEAKKVAATPGRDMFPRITPDGKRLVFTTEENGFPQIVSQPVGGGETTRHTTHTEGCQLECLSPDGTRALVRGLRDRSGYKPWRLMEIDLTRPSREVLLFDATAHTPAWSRDGKRILFCREGELPYRRGFHGSRASRIWSFHRETGVFRCEIPGEFEARSPLWLPDGSGFYFLSNQSGTANLWKKSGDANPVQLTFFDDEELLTPDLSADGSTLLVRHGINLLVMNPSSPGTHRTLEVFTHEPLEDRAIESVALKGCLHVDADAKGMAVFSEAGELWCSGPQAKTPTRLTTTPAAEEWPVFAGDADTLAFVSDDGIHSSIFVARLENGALIDTRTIHHCAASITNLVPSPDGGRLAWIEGNGTLRTIDLDGDAAPRTVFPGWDKPTCCWSPDSRWLAVAAEDANANRDIHLVSADATRDPVNLTRHPEFDGSPVWSPDGRRIVFTSKRAGAGEAALWCIDLGPGGVGQEPDAARLHAKADQAKPLPLRGIEPRRTIWSKSPDILYFQSRTKSNTKLYQFDFRTRKASSIHPTNGIPVRMLADGSLLWRVNRKPERLQKGESISCSSGTTMQRRREAFLRLGFRRIWRALGERFHDPAMNGRDWQAVRGKYEDLAARSRTSREFDHIIGRLMGELNASHLVFQRNPWNDEAASKPPKAHTLHPGLRFRTSDDDLLTIDRTLPGFPVAAGEDAPQPGETVTRIAGQPVDGHTPLSPLFHGSSGMRVPITVRNPQGAERTLAVPCLSYAEARKIDARTRTIHATDQAAARGIAYLRLRSMSSDSLATFRLALHRALADSSALLIDLRGNGGGREANRMLASLQQDIPFPTQPRNGPAGYPHERLPVLPWTKPVAVLCDQDTYSNAEIFCHAYLAAKRGPLIGMPTAGGVISAVKTDIQGLGSLQIPFRTWRDPKTAKSLDLNGARPTHPVPITPADEVALSDPQLEKALEILSSKTD